MADYLMHHGIKGQKWGIRRYQNYDGSYTRAGLKRYETSRQQYEKDKDIYTTAKKLSKTKGVTMPDGTPITVPKSSLDAAKINMKDSKRQMNKDYKHLRQDKLADQGKELYRNGNTITGNERTAEVLALIGGLTVTAAVKGNIANGQQSLQKALVGIGTATMASAAGMKAVNAYKAKRLRAYYGHTSNY